MYLINFNDVSEIDKQFLLNELFNDKHDIAKWHYLTVLELR